MKRFLKLLCIWTVWITAAISQAEPLALTVISVTPTVDTGGAYASGDLVGTKMTFADATKDRRSGELRGVILTDLSATAQNITLYLFSADPSSTTFTDNAAFDVADVDLPKVVAVVNLTSHESFADNSLSFSDTISKTFKTVGGTTLYGALVARAARTQTTTADITVRIFAYQD